MAEIKFDSLDSYFEDFHPHILIYSFNGAGKTTFAGSTGLRTILLDCGDAGVVTLRKQSKNKNLKVIRIKSISQYMDVIDKINRLSDKIDLLVVDTLTGLQSIAIKEVKGKGDMNQRKWGQAGGKVIECISETRIFPKDIIYLAQERRKQKGDDALAVSISPSLTPGTREALSSSVDWVGHLYVGEESKRKLSFILTDWIEAKDRAGLFPKIIGNPSYLPIRKRIIEAVNSKSQGEE